MMNNNTSEAPEVLLATVQGERWEDWLAGLLGMGLTGSCMILYAPCLKIFATDKELSKKPFYKIMLHLGIADMTQLFLLGIVGGVYTISQNINPTWLTEFFGGVLNSNWIACSAFANLLAFNRFVQVCFPLRAETSVFTPRNTNILIGVVWLWASAFFISYMTPWCSMTFLVENYLYYYGMNTPFCLMVADAEFYQNNIQIGFMALWYTCVVVRLRLLPPAGGSDKKEMRILVQCIFICSLIAIVHFNWFLIPPISDAKWVLFSLQLGWELISGINPVIYLIFNTQLRKKYKTLLGLGSARVNAFSTNNSSRHPNATQKSGKETTTRL